MKELSLNASIDGLFSSIARYAYNPETGPADPRIARIVSFRLF